MDTSFNGGDLFQGAKKAHRRKELTRPGNDSTRAKLTVPIQDIPFGRNLSPSK